MLKLAIVSANDQLARFLELEFAACGCTSQWFRSYGAVYEKFDAIIVDTDTIKSRDMSDVIKISAAVGEADEHMLPWPVSIESIRALCQHLENKSGNGNSVYDILPQVHNEAVYVISTSPCTVMLGGKYVKLSKTEFSILKLLCDASGALVSREIIMQHINAHEGNISDVYICMLRKKLEGNDGKRVIFTERGKGYRTVLELIT